MTINANGRLNIPTPGTPVRLSNDPSAVANRVFFQVVPGLTGKVYVGMPAMSKASLSGVARVLWPNATGGFSETFEVSAPEGENAIHLSEYAVDADVAGEGLLVTYWTV